MSQLLFLFTAFLMLSCVEGESVKKSDSDLEKMKLRGDVKSLCETVFLSDDSSGLKGDVPHYHSDFIFNKKGNITELKYYISDSTKWSSTVCSYDRPGRITEKLVFNDDLSETRREIWEYDKKGRLIEKADFNNLADLVYRDTYKYKPEENEIERVLCKSRVNGSIVSAFDSEGKVKRDKNKVIRCQVIKMLYKLDDKGNRIEEVYFKADNTPGARILNSYDEEGRKTEERHIRAEGAPGPWYRNNYDEYGNLIEICSYNEFDSLFYRVVMNYDNAGRLTERWSGTPQEDLRADLTIKYNANGDIIEEVRDFGTRQSISFYKYQYDEAGNWIRKVREETSGATGIDIPVSITERIIVYY